MNVLAIALIVAVNVGAIDKDKCGNLADYRPEPGVTFPGFYVKDSSIQVSDDAYLSATKLYYKKKNKCVDLGNAFSPDGLVQATKLMDNLDFSKHNALEDFLGFYFKAIRSVGEVTGEAYIAYLREDDSSGKHFLVISSPQVDVTNNKWGSYEKYIYQRNDCLEVHLDGHFKDGDKKRCTEILGKLLGYYLKENPALKY